MSRSPAYQLPEFILHPLTLRGLPVLCALLGALGLFAACSKEETVLAADTQSTPPMVMQQSAPMASNIKPSNVLLPEKLATIRTRVDAGKVKNMIFLIGENHVSLPVQRAEADLLGYLTGVYNVRAIYAEGFDQALPPLASNQPLMAKRATARGELERREITAVEYAAMAYPGVEVLGVEDMKAYGRHKTELGRLKNEFEASSGVAQWTRDFAQFVEGLQLDEPQKRRLLQAFTRASETCDANSIYKVLGDIIGPQSSKGHRLTALLESKKKIEATMSRKTADPLDSPLTRQLLEDRNKAIAANTLRYLTSLKSTDPVALVVGSLHIPGLEQDLRELAIPYVSILVAGIGNDLKGVSDKSDSCVYGRLDNGSKTELEKAFSTYRPVASLQIPPQKSSFRKSFQDKTELISILANADLMLRSGASSNQTLKVAQSAKLEQAQVEETFAIKDGNGIKIKIKMKLRDRIAYAYFSSLPTAIKAPAEAEKLEEGKLAGRYFTIYDGGDGGKPPIPPIHGTSMGPDDPDQRLTAVFAAQRQNNRRAVTVRFHFVHNEVVRQVDDLLPVPLGVTRDEVAKAVAAFREAHSGPDKLVSAQALARMLLVGIDGQITDDKTRIQQVSEGDLLKGLSLPFIARLANENDSTKFSTINGVTTIPWRDFQKGPDILARPVPPARPTSTLFWLDDRLTATPEGARVRAAIAARGIRVNQAARHGDSLVLLGAKEGAWSVTLNNGQKVSTKSDEFLQAIRSAQTVLALNVKPPSGLKPAAQELRVEDLKDEEVLETGKRLSERVEKNSGEDSIEEALRKAMEGDPAKIRIALRDHNDLKEVEKTLGASFKINEASMTGG